MLICFRQCTSITPFDRYIMSDNNKISMEYVVADESLKGRNFLTYGACSYAGEPSLILPDDGFKAHILIGRFDSLGGNIKFFMGKNHIYREVVSTYPFHVPWIYSTLRSYGKGYSKVATFKQKHHNNHWQIIIGHDVWIGEDVKIMGGVKIGSGAIIGANSVVAKDIPPYAIAVGNPARVVKYRFDLETIKKFMTIKWWYWDIEKVVANAPLMNDVEKFLSQHYPLAAKQAETNLDRGGIEIERYLEEGRNIYSFVVDFHAKQPIWKKIIEDFYHSEYPNAVLILLLTQETTKEDFEELKSFVKSAGISGERIIHCVPFVGTEFISPYILKKSTHFITNREMVSLYCLDNLYDTDVKIISGIDDGVFEVQ